MVCRSRVDNLITVHDSDYLVVYGLRDGVDHIRELQKTKYHELMKRYDIKENTCMASLLAYITNQVNFEGGEREHLPLRRFFREEDLEKWSSDTIRKNLKRLEGLGIVDIVAWEDTEEYFRENLNQIGKLSSGLKVAFEKFLNALRYERFVIPKETLSNERFADLFDPADPWISMAIESVSENKLRSIEQRQKSYPIVKIIEKIDLRKLSKDRRMSVASASYKRFKDAHFAGRIDRKCSKEERSNIIERLKANMKANPHILEAYIAGSTATGQCREDSDIDIVLKRSKCPDEDKCSFYKAFHEEGVLDIFCLTKEEFEESERRGALVFSSMKPL